MLKHELRHLKQELDGPRLARWRSTLGLAVASAAVRSFESVPSPGARGNCRASEESDGAR